MGRNHPKTAHFPDSTSLPHRQSFLRAIRPFIRHSVQNFPRRLHQMGLLSCSDFFLNNVLLGRLQLSPHYIANLPLLRHSSFLQFGENQFFIHVDFECASLRKRRAASQEEEGKWKEKAPLLFQRNFGEQPSSKTPCTGPRRTSSDETLPGVPGVSVGNKRRFNAGKELFQLGCYRTNRRCVPSSSANFKPDVMLLVRQSHC